ncbi:glutamate carboxypeptidase 2 [Nematostella vectensis]|uniref:glutamate carboxypeptidase 2 n=1 Tax=Nematostella vectensis TaxID=45351 RepID=UPI002076D6C1|nr:glutamate carboxypeptidase 2 [Nematostella vectensis]
MYEDDVELAYKKKKGARRRRCLVVTVVVLIAFLVGLLIGAFAISRSGSKEKHKIEDRGSQAKRDVLQEEFRNLMNAENLRENLKYFSSRPHIAGSPRQVELANDLARRWREAGFDRVEMPQYQVLLSFPQKDKPNLVTLLHSNGSIAYQTSAEEQIAEPSENDTLVIPPFLGYAPSGTVEGELVYVNYGRLEDFARLRDNLGINITGKIAIMRYGKNFRGNKVANAAKSGAIGAILFSDPADYAPMGYTANDTYPSTPWLPSTGAQRGSIYTGKGIGDPLTPGLPSIPGMYRRPYSQSELPAIPAHPMSYGDAVHFLSKMAGSAVPKEWRGSLDISYNLGPGLTNNMRVKLEVHNELEIKTIYNVIGTIYGQEEPDRYVLMGNHRDSWVFGAVDASTGTAVTAEISRGFGELMKKGWRPRRTIMMCSWGGEEFSLIGSREWVEQHSKALSERAITYINLDIAVGGNFVPSASGSPLLKSPIMSQLRTVQDTNAKKTLYDVMTERQPSMTTPKEPIYKMVGSGSDYAGFYHKVGVPVSDFTYDMGYNNRSLFYPVYHSQHDTFHWMVKFIDPDFAIHKSMAELGGSLLLDIADAPLLPLSVGEYAKKLNKSFAVLSQRKIFANKSISLVALENATRAFMMAADKFVEIVERAREDPDAHSFALLRRLNNQMVQVEKSFINWQGLPGRPLVRHVLFAPELHNTYGTSSFPGISDAVYTASQSGKGWDDVKIQISIATECVMAATEAIRPLSS